MARKDLVEVMQCWLNAVNEEMRRRGQVWDVSAGSTSADAIRMGCDSDSVRQASNMVARAESARDIADACQNLVAGSLDKEVIDSIMKAAHARP